jgi:RNA recognition motif-containing protein
MNTKLYVKNLSFNTEPFDLEKLFSNFGEVISVDIPKNRSSGRSNGFALVMMETQQGADDVIKNLNETVFKDFKIKINIVNE